MSDQRQKQLELTIKDNYGWFVESKLNTHSYRLFRDNCTALNKDYMDMYGVDYLATLQLDYINGWTNNPNRFN